jgi:hypothetical protein
MKEGTAIIESIEPIGKKRNVGGITLEFVDVSFRLEGFAEEGTLVEFKELDEAWGVSSETKRLWRHNESEPMTYQIRHDGTFTASLPGHEGLSIGKSFVVLLP